MSVFVVILPRMVDRAKLKFSVVDIAAVEYVATTAAAGGNDGRWRKGGRWSNDEDEDEDDDDDDDDDDNDLVLNLDARMVPEARRMPPAAKVEEGRRRRGRAIFVVSGFGTGPFRYTT